MFYTFDCTKQHPYIHLFFHVQTSSKTKTKLNRRHSVVMTITMAISTASTSSLLLHSSSSSSTSISGKPYSLSTHSSYAISIPKNAKVGIPHLGFTPFPQWNGLKSFGFSISHSPAKMKKEEGRSRGRGVFASLFGVGAPEALVIGVVALLVFGPKGLAEVARNLGKTLRAFQPTIRELQEVSRDFKSTLEREIGLDDIDNPVPKSSSSSAVKPTPETSETKAEPNGSLTENEEVKPDPYAKVSAPQLLGALAQLQKEQAEEREREEKEREEKEKEKEEKDNTQLQLETATPSPPDTEAKDTPQEAASPVMPPSQSPESNLLQGATSVPGPINESEM